MSINCWGHSCPHWRQPRLTRLTVQSLFWARLTEGAGGGILVCTGTYIPTVPQKIAIAWNRIITQRKDAAVSTVKSFEWTKKKCLYASSKLFRKVCTYEFVILNPICTIHVIYYYFFSAPGGDFQSVLDADMVPFEQDAQGFLRQILEALRFIHDKNIAHLDIKVHTQ